MIDHDVAVAIIGGSLGGVAAADPASVHPCLLTEEAVWLGGQLTAQGVSAPDEHAYIETFGAPASYLRLRAAIRQTYIEREGAPAIMAESVLGPNLPLNPGNGWVSRLCFLPARAAALFEQQLPVARLRGRVVSAEAEGGHVRSVTVEDASGAQHRIRARYFLDATDTGELLPLADVPFVTGAEARADTGEPHAHLMARPRESQGFTFCFAVEFCAGEDHTIPKPEGYEAFRDSQPYTLSPLGRDGQPVVYRMFDTSEQGNLPFWSYRRLHDGALLGGNDIALINWISNDYHGGDILHAAPDERARYLDEAKRLSLGFLYWLQTECPRDDGGYGYPELKLRPDVMGTADGLSQQPYIRESRRIVACTRIAEQDITAEHNDGARARHVEDSVGVGWYAMDLHPCVGNPSVSMYAPTRPFQIPLRALLPAMGGNLIAACKNIGTTHLTNGAYRLHPIEWAIGEAAGTLAAFCVEHDLTPAQVAADAWLTWRLQARLVRRGCPIFWAVDVTHDDPLFLPTQLLLVRGLLVHGSARWHTLTIRPDAPLGEDIDLQRLEAIIEECRLHGILHAPLPIDHDLTWAALCSLFEPVFANLR
ncbi:MAG: FAD-dependent oxidoreductase [Aggregatilineales bacterium]